MATPYLPELWNPIYERFLKHEEARTTPTASKDAEITSTASEDAKTTGPENETPRGIPIVHSQMQIGTVVTLRDIHGHIVPEDLRDVAVTVTDVDPEQNEIKFVANGKRKVWCLDGVDAVPARPLTIAPALREWLLTQSAGSETKCGYPEKDGGFCSWPAPCRAHYNSLPACVHYS